MLYFPMGTWLDCRLEKMQTQSDKDRDSWEHKLGHLETDKFKIFNWIKLIRLIEVRFTMSAHAVADNRLAVWNNWKVLVDQVD